MAFPSKFTSFDESILSKIPYLLVNERSDIELSELIKLTQSKFEDVSEFMLALDVLYALGKIELEEETGKIIYAD